MADPYNNPYPNPYQNQNQNGYPQNGYPNHGGEPGKNAAIASLVLGIVGLCFFAGFILGIIGLAMASKAKNEGYTGGLQTAGFILSLLSLIFGALATSCIVCSIAAL